MAEPGAELGSDRPIAHANAKNSKLDPGRMDTLWFAPELLEFVDHAAGTKMRLDGAPKKWTRSANGEWGESSDKKPWWRFW